MSKHPLQTTDWLIFEFRDIVAMFASRKKFIDRLPPRPLSGMFRGH
jgi:hypothetical protein